MNPLYTIETRMKKEDYRKFLYIATFFSSYLKIPVILLISVIGTYIIGIRISENIFILFFLWVILIGLTVFILCYDVETKNKKVTSSDDIGQFDALNVMKFYEDEVEFDNRMIRAKFSVKYNQIYRIIESADFFIILLTKTQATMIKKEDVRSLYDFTVFLQEKMGRKYRKLYVNI